MGDFDTDSFEENRKRMLTQQHTLSEDENPSKKPARGKTLTVRALLEAKSVGGVIGKAGGTISSLREKTGAAIEVAQQVAGARKRVVSVEGTIDQISTALHLIAEKVSEARPKRPQDEGTTDSKHELQIILLCPMGQVGAVIGKAGTKIKSTRESTGAQIKISEHPLDNSSEKSITIDGNSEGVQVALGIICAQMAENADKLPKVQYQPRPEMEQVASASNALSAALSSGGILGAYAQLGPAASHYQGYPTHGHPTHGTLMGGLGGGPVAIYGLPSAPAISYGNMGMGGGHGGGGGGGSGHMSAPQIIEDKIVIPISDALIGFVIGKGGSTIKEIRQKSRANIKISDKNSSGERTITISGSEEANSYAVRMVNEKLRQYEASNE